MYYYASQYNTFGKLLLILGLEDEVLLNRLYVYTNIIEVKLFFCKLNFGLI